jgi:protease I
MPWNTPLSDLRVAILATDGVERVEFEQPRGALHAAGAITELLSLGDDDLQAMQSDLSPAGSLAVDQLVSKVDATDYDALVLPGGTVSPDRLRTDADAVAFVRAIALAGKPIAAICHGPWTLIEADVVRGRRLASWPSLRSDLERAGGTWVDAEVVTDGVWVTSREPGDLPAFCRTMVEVFASRR